MDQCRNMKDNGNWIKLIIMVPMMHRQTSLLSRIKINTWSKNMKESVKVVWQMEKELILIRSKLQIEKEENIIKRSNIKDSGKTTSHMVGVRRPGTTRMEVSICMMANTTKVRKKEMVDIGSQTAVIIKVHSPTIRSMVKEKCCGQKLVTNLKVNSRMAKCKRVDSSGPMAVPTVDPSKTTCVMDLALTIGAKVMVANTSALSITTSFTAKENIQAEERS